MAVVLSETKDKVDTIIDLISSSIVITIVCCLRVDDGMVSESFGKCENFTCMAVILGLNQESRFMLRTVDIYFRNNNRLIM